MSSVRRATIWRLAAAATWTFLCSACGTGGHHRATATTVPATTTTVAPTTTTVPLTRYQVKRGDTLSGLAARFHIPSATIASLNHLANPDQLTVGQVLTIPNLPAPKPAGPGQAATLAVSPPLGPPGQVFSFTLSGAKAGETITFRITGPGGASFTGPPHTAPATGQVTAGYATSGADADGQYQVTAKGNQGTSAQGGFQLSSTATTTTSA